MTDTPDRAPAAGDSSGAAAAKGERIAKVLARAGVCSRRDAERLIAEGRVKVDGRTLDTPATLVTGDEQIVVDGKPVLAPEPARLWRYHKPAGVVTTHKDPEGRPTVFEKVADRLPRVISVGRLDINSEGLLLLTNDGELARKLEHPSNGWVRRYRVRVHGLVKPEALAKLEKGVTIDGVRYGPITAVLDRQQGTNAWITVSLTEGKNREVRKVMEHLGYTVTRLLRISYGPFHLGMLDRGAVEEVPARVLRDQLGRSRGGGKGDKAGKAASRDTSGRAVAKLRKRVRPSGTAGGGTAGAGARSARGRRG